MKHIDNKLFYGLEVKDIKNINRFMSLLFKNINSELIWTLYDDSVFIYHKYSELYIQRKYINEYNILQTSVITKNELLNLIRKNKLKKICLKLEIK